MPPEQIKQLTDYLDNWDDVSFDDKRIVLDKLVDIIYATSEQRLNGKSDCRSAIRFIYRFLFPCAVKFVHALNPF